MGWILVLQSLTLVEQSFTQFKLGLVSSFTLSIYCITLLAGGDGEILLPTNSGHHNPAHSLVVSSGSLPANHQHAKLFIPIRVDSLTLAQLQCYKHQ